MLQTKTISSESRLQEEIFPLLGHFLWLPNANGNTHSVWIEDICQYRKKNYIVMDS